MKTYQTYRLTLLASAVSLMLITASLVFNLDLFEVIIDFLHRFEDMELDEVLLAGMLFLSALSFDLWTQRKDHLNKQVIEEERLHVLRATMVTVMDAVNTLVASIQLFQIEMEERKMRIPIEMMHLDKSIENTVVRLKSLQRLEKISEKKIGENIYAIETPDLVTTSSDIATSAN